MGGSLHATTTEAFLKSASRFINDNDDSGLADGGREAATNSDIRGIFSSSIVNSTTMSFEANSVGTFANRVRIGFMSSSELVGGLEVDTPDRDWEIFPLYHY